MSKTGRWLITVVLLSLGLGFGASSAAAGPVGLQATGGWYTDSNNFFLGAGARMGLGSITAIPNAEYVFVDNAKSWSLNLDGTMSVLPLGIASVYAGGGIGWLTTDPDNGKSNTDTVVNLIAGAGLNTFPMKPFAQLKYVIKNGNDPFQFAVGVRF
jgi:hypothetical protein